MVLVFVQTVDVPVGSSATRTEARVENIARRHELAAKRGEDDLGEVGTALKLWCFLR